MTDKHPEIFICEPCRNGHHVECEESKDVKCDCLVCLAQRIGDRYNYDLGGNFPRERATT